MIESYPLYWPEYRPRTTHRQHSRFITSFATAVRYIKDELRRLGATDVIISTNVPLRRDGLPMASAKPPEDTGVAVYFAYDKRHVCFACDRWNRVYDNIYAIAKTIEAVRGIERWGSGDMVNAAFRGFEALPPAVDDWRMLLGNPATINEAEKAYKKLVKTAHPDVGGSHERMTTLNHAMEMARVAFGGTGGQER